MKILSHVLSVALASTGKAAKREFPMIHSGFSGIADRYDAFILDQFGVIHNGVSALPGAIECVEYLSNRSKQLIILSNTSAPAKKALERLPKLGFPSVFVNAVTSGEEASKYILEKYGAGPETKRVVFFTWDMYKPNNPRLTAPPQTFLDQCGNVEVAASIEEADFLLLHGSEIWYKGGSTADEAEGLEFADTGSFDKTLPFLQACLDRKLPLVCANPDNIVQTPEGGVAYMPGKMAAKYKEMGGDCKVFGKPDAEHFRACLKTLGIDPSRVAHVGDSLHHDIAGATEAGIDSVFVTSGIHKDDLRTEFGKMPSKESLTQLFTDTSIWPTHVVSLFEANSS